jgi:hypothetical protein
MITSFIMREIHAREGVMAPPDHHLPVPLKPGQLATAADTHLVPALIADAGEPHGATSSSSPPTSATRTRAGLTRARASNSSPGARIAD